MNADATVLELGAADAVLRVRGVSKWFGDVCVLDRIDLQLRPGEVVGLIGPGGVGKSEIGRAHV